MVELKSKIEQNIQVNFSFPVFFTKNIFDVKNKTLTDCIHLKEKSKTHKVLFIVDENLLNHYSSLLKDISSYIKQSSNIVLCNDVPLVVNGGEQAKNNPYLVEEIQILIEKYKICRHSFVIALGGGAVLDMVGYAASTPHRGVRLIRIPTTVLSQNDSGIGVKNAINAYSKKNFLGTFSPPFAVINDSNFLHSLEYKDWISGISEAIKVSIIKDQHFFTFIENNTSALVSKDITTMEKVIFRCAELHLEHIRSNGDPFELGHSRPLDFGHWSAHKLETLSHYRISHGEAVAVGIVLDSCYAMKKKLLDENSFLRIANTFHNLGFKLFYNELKDPEFINGLEEFREHLGGELAITLPFGIGKKQEVNVMDTNIIAEAVLFLEEKYG